MAAPRNYEGDDHGGDYDPNQHTTHSNNQIQRPIGQLAASSASQNFPNAQNPLPAREPWIAPSDADHGGDYDPNRSWGQGDQERTNTQQSYQLQTNYSSHSQGNQQQQIGTTSSNSIAPTAIFPSSSPPQPSCQPTSHRTISSHSIGRRPVGQASPRQIQHDTLPTEPLLSQSPLSPSEKAITPSASSINAKANASAFAVPVDQRGYEYSTTWRPKIERGYTNFFDASILKWKFPNSIRLPNVSADDGIQYNHLDILRRPFAGTRDDRYISPFDAHVSKLVVQCSQDVFDAMPAGTWRRTFVRNNCPLLVRIACWATSSFPEGREATWEELGVAFAKWLPASIALLVIMSVPVQAAGEIRNGGKYDPFSYHDWSYPYDARNKFEAHDAWTRDGPYTSPREVTTNATLERLAEPNRLCFLTEDGKMELSTLDAWRERKGENAPTDYVLVSYTSKHFPNRNDWDYLHEVGKHAAKAAGVAAYWVGCSCLGSKAEVEENVWKICDIIRSAHSLVIAVSGPPSIDSKGGLPRTLLRDWGSRVWTWPEILLSSSKKSIKVYRRGVELGLRSTILRRNFPPLWGDAAISGTLVDHYEGSLILGPLELITTALRCLHNRETQEHLPGDMSYALMGLMSKRPHVEPKDTAFQAFARLSLANDSSMLLERMICILPKSLYEPWHSLDDQWGVSLWDIYPKTQVCGIGENDTVILDGARAAAIRWKAFAPVVTLARENWKRTIMRLLIRSVSYIFLLGVGLIAAGVQVSLSYSNSGGFSRFDPGAPYKTIGGIILGVALVLSFASPYLVRTLYTGKVWGAQPWLFGVEGYVNIHNLERHIFGIDLGHLKWSVAGSPLSRHKAATLGDGPGAMRNVREGTDPLTDPEVSAKIQRALQSSVNEEKIFTLVDTYTMTATIFSAVRPPVAALMCGEEGGMQRAVLCSYEWTSQTLYRESVIRMETPAYESMDPVSRVKLGLQRNSR